MPSQQRCVLALTCRAFHRELDRAIPRAGVGHRLLGRAPLPGLEPRQTSWPVLPQTQEPLPCRRPTTLTLQASDARAWPPAAPGPQLQRCSSCHCRSPPALDRTRSAARPPRRHRLPLRPPPTCKGFLSTQISSGAQAGPEAAPGWTGRHLLEDLQAEHICP